LEDAHLCYNYVMWVDTSRRRSDSGRNTFRYALSIGCCNSSPHSRNNRYHGRFVHKVVSPFSPMPRSSDSTSFRCVCGPVAPSHLIRFNIPSLHHRPFSLMDTVCDHAAKQNFLKLLRIVFVLRRAAQFYAEKGLHPLCLPVCLGSLTSL